MPNKHPKKTAPTNFMQMVFFMVFWFGVGDGLVGHCCPAYVVPQKNKSLTRELHVNKTLIIK